jgi:hypothetical protein
VKRGILGAQGRAGDAFPQPRLDQCLRRGYHLGGADMDACRRGYLVWRGLDDSGYRPVAVEQLPGRVMGLVTKVPAQKSGEFLKTRSRRRL